jgi:hypothetical protein
MGIIANFKLCSKRKKELKAKYNEDSDVGTGSDIPLKQKIDMSTPILMILYTLSGVQKGIDISLSSRHFHVLPAHYQVYMTIPGPDTARSQPRPYSHVTTCSNRTVRHCFE